MYDNLFIPNKMDYVRGYKRPDVNCILCAIVEGNDKVERLEVYRSELFVIALNIYPYSPGHLMIFPKRHITDPREFNNSEVIDLHRHQTLCLDVLESIYSPQGFNVGYNIGEAGGASIPHTHLHIVPRYKKELGFIDIIGGVKIIVEDPNVSLERVKEAFARVKSSSYDQ